MIRLLGMSLQRSARIPGSQTGPSPHSVPVYSRSSDAFGARSDGMTDTSPRVCALSSTECGDGLVYRGDGAGAFAGGGGYPLHRAGVDVADREHAGNAGLERERPPSQCGPGRSEVIVGQLDVGPDATVVPGGDR